MVVANFATTTQHGAIEGKTQTSNVEFYNLDVERLLGFPINKQFIPSVANTVGINMRNYKIIKKNQSVLHQWVNDVFPQNKMTAPKSLGNDDANICLIPSFDYHC